MKSLTTSIAAAIYILFLSCSTSAGDFLLQDDDTVVFLGDSITAARGYTKVIEHYALMRFPNRRIRFYNAGKGGDTAESSLQRLDRDVFARGATVMVVALGVNDIGWGARADQDHKQKYLDGVKQLIIECRQRNIRVVLCSPAITAEPSSKAEVGFLQSMADEGLALAKSLGGETVDVQRLMRDIQRTIEAHNATESDAAQHVHLHAADGVHLNDLGQLAMAFAILKGLGAPGDVSSATLDSRSGEVLSKSGCEITDVVELDDGVAFTRLDVGLPITRGPLSSLDYRWIPIPEQLNRYMLRVEGLAEGSYKVTADGRLVQRLSAAQLAEGVNLGIMTPDPWEPGGPWNVQSDIVEELVDARDKLLYGQRLNTLYGIEDEGRRFDELDDQLTDLQRRTARPRRYRFEIKLIKDP
jgi:lysophospholipase L1-like esterase